MYTRFLVKSMPASAHQLQRSGRPDATAAQLASSQEEFMVAAYENCYSPVVITSADAAVELIRHLRKHGVHTPFVVFAAPKKLAAWQRYLQKKFTGRVSIFASQADFVDVDWRLQEGAIVSYAAAAYWPKRLVRLSYVILDDVRTYMWRPTFTHTCSTANFQRATPPKCPDRWVAASLQPWCTKNELCCAGVDCDGRYCIREQGASDQ